MDTGSVARVAPGFARLADDLLREGKIQEALAAAVAGTRAFPWYATGAMLLGRCYDAQGRKVEAMLEYRRALRRLPDNLLLQKLLREAEERQQEEFAAFADTRTRDLKARRDSMTFAAYEAEAAPATESTVEFLLRQLQGAKRLTPVADEQAPLEGPVVTDGEPSGKIVTATLAEIYASQGQFREAVKAYRALLEQRPEDAQRYSQRLAELEELARAARIQDGA